MKFNELHLSAELLAEIDKAGFVEASPIQEQTIPLAMAGKDVIGQAQTGTGKTAAFGFPTLEKIDTEDPTVQALIIAPTRELAVQSQEELFRFGRSKGVKVRSVYGGSSIEKQIKALKSGAHIVVGTPGRLLDLIKRKALKLNHVETLILDEADEMLNMGFLEDIEAIISRVPEDRQTLLFSATMPDAIKQIGVKFMKEPEHVKIAAKELTTELVDQYYIRVKENEKFDTMTRLMDVEQPELSIVFGRTKRRVDELTRGLKIRGFRAEGIHGDLDQGKRLRVLRDFKNGNLDVLVATDVAARGLDISGVTHVYNYDIPQDPESYVHRIGRTGRAGKSGQSITFVAPNEMGYLQIIESLTKKRMKGMKPATAEEAFQAKKKVALKKIERDFADETIRSNFEKFGKDARKLAAEFTPEELALYILSLTVQDPDTLPEVEIAREKPLPFKYVSGANKGNRNNKGGNRRERGSRRGNYKKGGRNEYFDKEKRYRKEHKKPRNTSSEKKTGFVIRNKGDK
ncbi:DEAD/DEAH box helicase [Streptococcus constellatus subsp. pharyngis]|uniref:DEAD-box ATP-dependent RNA helicase CshA n=1 Tax=Streptococcus constellatus subsp. pharyngis SK1060 = CCUG 46377 TaxID=1035184 RepID=F9P6W1_STRCV|nr:DEAD/DEAH box helicase [Streptococcus constellatus]AGU73197.1 ATP-dependent RNA helicase [Streptococcus constellatus subsp. pharyngis C232]AGU74951.1 ATP-dependent RNA helicase [Streptococcus constellatus subsp. pharyngis C818]AGU80342.1 ATP-dependent RNA helicase [Streptococcus constellatus subsp. pharyngis C1050]EGV08073.1 DEAD/DEAH box helicase [Streptococcus constellatus subsp. pharyngis SK1060 = CCUG 46377]QQC22918.1 DEAD/DEAH box helicase [Streptococcus constellatus]